jgi:hypothetical protein
MTDSADPWANTPELIMHPDKKLIIASFLINIVNPHKHDVTWTGNTFKKPALLVQRLPDHKPIQIGY